MDTADRHQALHALVLQCLLCQRLVKHAEVGRATVEIGQVALDCQRLIQCQGLRLQPGPAGHAEQLALVRRDQVGMKDTVDPVLRSRHLLDHLRTLRYQAAQCLSRLVWHPDLGQKATGVQLCQHCSVDLVGLDLGVRDCSDLQRVGDHHTPDKWTQQMDDRRRVNCGFDHHLVVGSQLASERDHRISREIDTAATGETFLFQYSDHGHGTMHVQPYDSHAYLQAFSSRSREPAGNTTLTDPRSQRNQVGRRGRPDNNTSSQLIRYPGLPTERAPDAPVPVARGYSQQPKISQAYRWRPWSYA